jgi:hypothetical protein
MTTSDYILAIKDKYSQKVNSTANQELMGVKLVNLRKVEDALLTAYIEIIESYFDVEVTGDDNFFTIEEAKDIMQHINNLLNTNYWVNI